jgi:hypothetical protein
MQDQRDRIGAEVAGQIRGDGFHDLGRLRWVGEIFANREQLALALIEGGDVGEGAADIDADAQIHRSVFLRRSRTVASASIARSVSRATP